MLLNKVMGAINRRIKGIRRFGQGRRDIERRLIPEIIPYEGEEHRVVARRILSRRLCSDRRRVDQMTFVPIIKNTSCP